MTTTLPPLTSTIVPHVARARRRRAALYKRISSDREGKREGVERQNEDTHAMVQRLDVDVVAVFEDNDRSASRYSTKPRPAYEEMVRRARSGEFDVIIGYSTSRLTRRPNEVEDLIDLVEKYGVDIVTCVSGRYDVTTADGRMVARFLAAADAAEVDRTSERLRRAFDQHAAAGRPHGKVTYGWQRVDGRDVIDPEQAAVLRELAARYLARESGRSICADLNRRGVPAPKGGEWVSPIARQLLLRERNAGRQVHRGKVIGKGEWDPIFDDDTHDRLVALLRDPARVTARGTAPCYLLSGIAVCGRCGGVMRPNKATSAKHASYACASCHRVRRRFDLVDAVVEAAVVARLSAPDGPDMLGGDGDALTDALARVAAIRARLDTAADKFADEQIDGEQMNRITARLRPRLADAERDVAAARPADPALRALLDGDVAANWKAATLEVKRAVIRLVCHVTIEPSRSGARFDSTLIRTDFHRMT